MDCGWMGQITIKRQKKKKKTRVPRGTLAAQDAGDHQEILETKEARDIEATTELPEVQE